MRLAGLPRLFDFTAKHPDAQGPIEAWIQEVKAARWRSPHDLKRVFPRASLLGKNRVVFDLRHNRFRLDTAIHYETQQVVVIRVGTHREYERWKFE